jgi:hypothetical protein
MPSTYTTNNGIEKIATGEQSGTWGDTTNVNFDLLDEALDGQVSVVLTGTGTSGSPNDLEITDGTSSNGRNRFVEFTGTPGGDTYVRLTPNDAEKVLFIQNSTNQTLLLFQGTYDAARDYPLEAGRNAVVRFTGTGTTSYAYNALEDLKVSTLETDILSVSDDTTGEVIITSTAAPTQLRVQSNDDGAADGPRLDLYRNSSSPADDDNIGQIYFSGEDDGGGKHQYAKIESFIEDATAGSEGGRLNFNVISGGAGKTMLMLRSDTGGTDGEVVINENANSVNFRIQGSTAGNLFVTDAASDKIIIGHDTPQNTGGSQAALQITGLDAATAAMSITRHQAAASGPQLRFAKSRVSTKNDTTIVQSGDDLGSINFYGADGTDLASLAAQILAEVDGTPGVDDMPGRLRFMTTADGANSPTERMRIQSDGKIGIGTTSPSAEVEISTSSTTGPLRLTSTDNASVGDFAPEFELYRNIGTSNVANDDALGLIQFLGDTTTSTAISYANVQVRATDVTNSNKEATFSISTRQNNSMTERLILGPYGAGIGGAGNTASLLADTALYVQGTGRFRKTNNDAAVILESTDTDSTEGPQLHLLRNSSSPADNDSTGVIKFRAMNSVGAEINYAEIQSQIVDVTDGTEDGRLKFIIYKGGSQYNTLEISPDEVVVNEGSQDIDFRVESDGNANMLKVDGGNNSVLIGTGTEINSTSTVLNVEGSGRALDIYRSTATASNNVINVYSNFGGTKTINASIDVDGDMENTNNRYTGFSDQRFKQDIVDATSQWDDIKALQVRKYRFINLVEQLGDDAPVHLGVIAQELEASGMGGLVKTKPMDEDNPDAGDRKSVAYSVLYMKAVKALQEAMERIETLETKVAALEAE